MMHERAAVFLYSPLDVMPFMHFSGGRIPLGQKIG